eukprot:CAMPEP_0117658694 /NCGR_PEP_ID=MMETSP0804-20121206/5999_1 /TAXON_ID=1074897 /ORGANISM="Tetraselmis astigmatica, Strain CCMP880" /LENGTH=1341 /DNA_ID=CAMNT_0005465229 /DNA_START=538 /DNA_END=4563 /DNA_ORIENTATION=+
MAPATATPRESHAGGLMRRSSAWQKFPKDEYVTSLRRGSSLVKFGRTGSPHFTFFRISDDESELVWKSELVGHGRKLRAVQLSSVKKIVEGQTTPTFHRESKPNLEHLSFSLIYDKKGKERTLDLICKTEQEYELWLHGLQAFVSFQKQKQCRLHNAESEGSVSNYLPLMPHHNETGETPAAGGRASNVGSFLCDVYVWGGREADLTIPVDGWQQSLVPVLVNDSARLNARQVCVGSSHAVLSTKQGQLYTWGRGTGGQLGQGGSQDYSQPKLIYELWERGISIAQVACSDNLSLAVSSSGDVYSWGEDKKSGALGHGKGTDKCYTPRKIEFPIPNARITDVSAGPFHCAAITTLGGLYTWGDGFEGRLGNGTHESRHKPAFVEYFNEMRVISVACGVFHTAAVARPSYEASAPGSPNTPGDLLSHPSEAAAAFTAKSFPPVPMDLNWGPPGSSGGSKRILPKTPMMLCVSGSKPQTLTPNHSVMVDLPVAVASVQSSAPSTSAQRAHVFTWGANDRGCLGRGEEGEEQLIPGEVAGELASLDVRQVSCGYHLTVAVTSCGRVFQWGSTGTAMSEAAPWTRSNEPKQVKGDLEGWYVSEVHCGNHHCIAQASSSVASSFDSSKPSQVLFGWGRGIEGQLGNDSSQDSSMPVKIKALKGLEVVKVVAGAHHSMAICKNNPAVTEAAAMKDAERLKPYLLGVKPREEKKLTIDIPSGYTTGAPLSAPARGSHEGSLKGLRNSADAGALILHPTAAASPTVPTARQTSTRHRSSKPGTFGSLFRAAQATQMARKAATNAAKTRMGMLNNCSETPVNLRPMRPFPAGTPDSTSTSTASISHRYGIESSMWSPDVPTADNSPDRSIQSDASIDSSPENSAYVRSLERQVINLANKVKSLEEQLERRTRYEHEHVRQSFTQGAQKLKGHLLINTTTTPASSSESADSAAGRGGPRTSLSSNGQMFPQTPLTHNNETPAGNMHLTPVTDGQSDEVQSTSCKVAKEGATDSMGEGMSGVRALGNGGPLDADASSSDGEAEEATAATACSLQHAFHGAPSVAPPEAGISSSSQLNKHDAGTPGGPAAADMALLHHLPGSRGRRHATADGEITFPEDLTAEMHYLKKENSELRTKLRQLEARLRLSQDGSTGSMASTSTHGTPSKNALKPDEWLETVHPGVHLTLAIGPSGKTELRKVRFSSKAFSKAEAERWWRENRLQVAERCMLASSSLSRGASGSRSFAQQPMSATPSGGILLQPLSDPSAPAQYPAAAAGPLPATPVTPVGLLPGLGGELAADEEDTPAPADSAPGLAPPAATPGLSPSTTAKPSGSTMGRTGQMEAAPSGKQLVC